MTLRDEWNKYAPELEAFAAKVDSVLKFAATNKTLLGIEEALPGGSKIAAALGIAEADAALAAQFVPAVNGVIAAYELYQALGGRPMDANDIARIHHDLEEQ